MANQFIRNLMGEQRKRALGSVMTYVEREVYPHLSESQQKALRHRIVSALTQYHDTALDVLKSAVDDGGVVNQEALAALTRMDANLSTLAKQVGRG